MARVSLVCPAGSRWCQCQANSSVGAPIEEVQRALLTGQFTQHEAHCKAYGENIGLIGIFLPDAATQWTLDSLRAAVSLFHAAACPA